MQDLEASGWLAGGVVGGLVLFGAGFSAWRRLRLIEDTPTSRVRSMALGRVELAGRALGKADLEAPSRAPRASTTAIGSSRRCAATSVEAGGR